MSLRYLEDYAVGLVVTSGEELVTKEAIVAFAKAWDPQPFHVDEDLAARSPYGGLIACTAHIFAITCRLGAKMENKDAGLAGLDFDEMRVHQPLRAGDTVHYQAECTAVRPSKTKPDRGIVHNHTRLFNQHEELVFSVRCTMMIASRRRQASEAAEESPGR